MVLINKDTKIYCSFSSTPGNNGCVFFNKRFQENNINAIYKSFYSSDIKKSIEAVKTLGISGFAVSMPFKVEVLKYVDEIDDHVKKIGAANTIINVDGKLKAYNTDWLGVTPYLNGLHDINILGNGGFSKAIQYCCEQHNVSYRIITRKNWDEISILNGVTFNATPIDVMVRGTLIDGRAHTETGKRIMELLAEEQYKLYTKHES